MIFVRCTAGSVSSNYRTGRTKEKMSHSSKIPILRSRSASLSRPGSRCSRPRPRPECQLTGNSESVIPSSSSWKTRPDSVRAAAIDDRNVDRNSDCADAGGDARPRRKSPIHMNLESAVTTGNRKRNNNWPEKQLPGPAETVGSQTTETLNLDCDGQTLGDVVEEGLRAASVEDKIRQHSSFQTSGRCLVGERKTSASRRERRSFSLDCTKPWTATRR